MTGFEDRSWKAFDLFRNRWALVCAGTPERFNCCTVGWGSLGTLWSRPVVTVYLHPARYTTDFMLDSETFTVSLYPPERRRALGILGSRSGRDGDKVAAAGLTPVPLGGSVTFAEATTTFLCRKLYEGRFEKEGLASDIRDLYISQPRAFPPDADGDWQPHWIFVGEVIEVAEG